MSTHCSSCLENPMDRGAWRGIVHKINTELDMTEATQHICTYEYCSIKQQYFPYNLFSTWSTASLSYIRPNNIYTELSKMPSPPKIVLENCIRSLDKIYFGIFHTVNSMNKLQVSFFLMMVLNVRLLLYPEVPALSSSILSPACLLVLLLCYSTLKCLSLCTLQPPFHLTLFYMLKCLHKFSTFTLVSA